MTNPHYHILTPPKNWDFPKRLLFFDTETYRKPITVKIAGEERNGYMHFLRVGYYLLYDYDENLKDYKLIDSGYFYTKKEFTKLILRKTTYKKDLYVFAHNMSFDFRIAVDYDLLQKEFDTKFMVVDGSKFILKLTKYYYVTKNGKKKIKKTKRVIFLDSTNYTKKSLEKIGKIFGLPKLHYDFSKTIDKEELTNEEWRELKEYNKRDVEVLALFIITLLKKLVIGKTKFGETISKLSFNLYKTQFLKHKIEIHHYEDVSQFERQSYFGGRTECFKIGFYDETIYKLDVNSLYPSVMINNDYPTRLIYFGEFDNVIKHDIEKNSYLYIIDATIETKEPNLPYRLNNRLVFPVGRFRGVWTSAELNLDDDRIIKIHKIAYYEKAKIFHDYIGHMYNERLKAKERKDDVMNEFYKYLMNSLYGKLGQKSENYIRLPQYDGLAEWGLMDLDNKKIRFFDGYAFLVDGFKDGYDTFVAIPSFVTSYARAYMWKLMKIAGLENLFYMDTDSLFTTYEGYKRLEEKGFIDNRKLGYLKNEGIFDAIEVRTLKDYSLFKYESGKLVEKIKKTKGVKKSFIWIDKDIVKGTKFMGFWESVNKFGKPFIVEVEMTKRLKREYNKGNVVNGLVVPYVLNAE